MQVNPQGGDRLTERRTGFQSARRRRGRTFAAAGATAAEQPYRVTSGLVGGNSMRSYTSCGVCCPAGNTAAQCGQAPSVASTTRSGFASSARPTRGGSGAAACRRRDDQASLPSTAAVRNCPASWPDAQFGQPLLKFGDAGQRRLQLPDERQQRQDELILLRDGQLAEVDLGRHTELESVARDRVNHFRDPNAAAKPEPQALGEQTKIRPRKRLYVSNA